MKLKDCCIIIAGQSPESKYYNREGVGLPFFQGKADFGSLYPTIRVYCSKPTKVAEKGDILLSVRAPVGPTNLAPCTVCIGRGLTAIRPSDKLLTRYVLLYFRYFEAQLASKGTGTTFKAITQDVVKNLDIPVPSLDEQARPGKPERVGLGRTDEKHSPCVDLPLIHLPPPGGDQPVAVENDGVPTVGHGHLALPAVVVRRISVPVVHADSQDAGPTVALRPEDFQLHAPAFRPIAAERQSEHAWILHRPVTVTHRTETVFSGA